jgi:hypothetical protein
MHLWFVSEDTPIQETQDRLGVKQVKAALFKLGNVGSNWDRIMMTMNPSFVSRVKCVLVVGAFPSEEVELHEINAAFLLSEEERPKSEFNIAKLTFRIHRVREVHSNSK